MSGRHHATVIEVHPTTDTTIRKGKVNVNLSAAFSEVNNPYAATLHDGNCTFCHGDPVNNRAITRYYPQDGEIWWIMREQVMQMRSALGLENMTTTKEPALVGKITQIKALREQGFDIEPEPGVDLIKQEVIAVTKDEYINLVGIDKQK
eukprot:GHVH01010607.1.p2 GENE.GHVH01010607.1~~GHVH01010607.1.p2  ORF type:complete len:149 (+),score=13.27 GHVH01010607.1:636-1082(+)